MRQSIQVFSILTVCLSLTSLAVAQTTTPQEQPASPPPAANDATGNLPPATLPPQPPTAASPVQTAPAAPVGPAPSASLPAANAPMPPAPVALRVRTPDCESNWTRGGFYLRFGSGIGDVRMSGTGPKGSTSLSGLGSNSLIAIGGSVARGLVLAGTAQVSSVSATFNGGPFVDEIATSNGKSLPASSKADAAAMGLGGLVDWYPDPDNGWHVGVSAGLGVTNVKNHADGSTLSGNSAAGSLFGGYDWAIGPRWSFGLALIASGTTSASLKDSSDQPQAGYRLKSYAVGISGSFLCF